MKRLIIVDISSFVFRAFFAIRPLHSPDGTPVNAVHGVLSMLLKLFSEYSPSHIFIAQDTGDKTFRSDLYPEYKANRQQPPEDLIPQFDILYKILGELNIPQVSLKGYEADDIIGTAALQWKDDFEEILIASGDKDLMQLVADNVKMVDTMKNVVYNKDEVQKKMGVEPGQIVDYLSMVGDSSDNIPGMRGIGPKGAIKLLQEHGTLEECIAQKDSFKGKKLVTAFTDHLEDALTSKKLVTIVTDLSLNVALKDLKYHFQATPQVLDTLRELGLKALLTKFEQVVVSGDEKKEVMRFIPHKIETENDFEQMMSMLEKTSNVAIDCFFDGKDPYEREIQVISLSFDGVKGFHCPISHDRLKRIFAASFKRKDIEIYSSQWQELIAYLLRTKQTVEAKRFDVIQAHFVANPDANSEFNAIMRMYLDLDFNELEQEKQELQRGPAIYLLAKKLKEELKTKNLENIYHDIDNPLTPVLAHMEMNGVMINKEYFLELEEELDKKILAIEKKVQGHGQGTPINLNSPKQVSSFLFDDLGLPIIKKTKTGFSTDVEVLNTLDKKNISPVPGLILQHRELGKLLSTYVRNLPGLINPSSGRIHTRFHQNIAATGRLSSTNPNLQNIPIRTEMGRRVRKGFIAHPGFILLGADYSQVELRLLAYFSQDPVMLEAFKNDRDIHRQTASEILDIPLDKVTQDERSRAKAVNFGLMYGQSSFGLASQLGISRKEAKDYITRYFLRFIKVKEYLDSLKEFADKAGYSLTVKNRKRFWPDIRSQNRTIKAMAERGAINTPIQGSAADIIKIAMVDIQNKLNRQKLTAKMIIQVHDELIFEVSEEELNTVKSLVKDSMENILGPDRHLKVDMNIGISWYDLKINQKTGMMSSISTSRISLPVMPTSGMAGKGTSNLSRTPFRFKMALRQFSFLVS